MFALRNKSWVRPAIQAVVALTVIAGIWTVVFGFYRDATARQWQWLTRGFIQRGFMPDWLDVTQWTGWAYLVCAIAIGLVAYAFGDRKKWILYTTTGVAILLFITSVVTFARGINDHSGSYAGSTTFMVADTDEMPDSLKRLADEATLKSEKCDMLANKDMPGCIAEESMDYNWEARSSSLVGATQRIKRASTGNNRTELLTDTLTYVYGDDGEGSWTAIRDGKSRQPIYGILSYDGKTDPTICKFEGEYALDKAFGGRWGHNLADEIADKFPDLFYENSDRYGYCDDDKPVIVIPVRQYVAYNHRTAYRAAGVLVITGSPTSDAIIQHVTTVEPGDFPGPVYPASLAKEQRESMGMIAGILNSMVYSFGYETVEEESQDGNVSEYLLRDSNDGRIYWVTPLKQREGDNQRIVAYSVIPADNATAGSLNELKVFVLNDNDPRVASISDMETSVRQKLSEQYPGFYSAKGYLAEFLPLDDKTWQVYAEINGRVVFRVIVPVDTDISPTVYEIESVGDKDTDEGPTTKSACVEDLKSLDNAELTLCLNDVADEFSLRQAS
jgi:hypothetical protein